MAARLGSGDRSRGYLLVLAAASMVSTCPDSIEMYAVAGEGVNELAVVEAD